MLTLRKIPSFLYLLPPLLAYAGCSSSDDSSSNTGGTGGSAQVGGSAGKGGSAGTAGKGGSTSSAGTTSEAGNGAGGANAGTTGTGEAGASEGGEAGAGEAGAGPTGTGDLNQDINTIVVIYAENRSFDNMFGNFPGAHGLSDVVGSDGKPTAAYHAQLDRDGSTKLTKLPKTWGGVTLAGNPTTVTEAQSDGLANAPFGIENAFVGNGAPMLATTDVTRDLTHRFFENQMEVNGGTNDMFAAFLDAGGLTMGHWDYSGSSLYKLAQEYVLADNFFEGAFGGSFLNHQYMICACAPAVSADFVASNKPSVNVLTASPNAKGVPQLVRTDSNASAIDGPPKYSTGAIAPLDYFGTGDGYRAVNTIQPAYEPSGEPPAGAGTLAYADATKSDTLPPQTQTTIGDTLNAKSVTWAWYAGAWNAALADGMQDPAKARTVIYAPSAARAAPDFQPHHQAFNYYAAFDPVTHAADRAAHLKDYNDLLTDIQKNQLPSVVFYKPQGNLNQHPGYANINDGDEHIADVVKKLQASSQWGHMLIVVTYDEYGGQWDHVAPPKGDLIGPGSRIPAIIISPYAKKGTVDHTQYDTGSIARFITKRWGLTPLAGITTRDTALTAVQGGTKMGDLTGALNL